MIKFALATVWACCLVALSLPGAILWCLNLCIISHSALSPCSSMAPSTPWTPVAPSHFQDNNSGRQTGSHTVAWLLAVLPIARLERVFDFWADCLFFQLYSSFFWAQSHFTCCILFEKAWARNQRYSNNKSCFLLRYELTVPNIRVCSEQTIPVISAYISVNGKQYLKNYNFQGIVIPRCPVLHLNKSRSLWIYWNNIWNLCVCKR